ncbi:GNAT family N-acetyltransferase [Gorillibacterium timonense]|uniref:GNAT family N-acetyltransferase n=1 Tax=Gorillibacterium timonense TaxID=1689269 RepID=UPI00071D3179|nr:GNAT family N-acetyltransferase [Gorillibacterium timonense]
MNAVHIVNSEVMDGIQAYRAKAEDADALSELMLSTARWLKSTGSTQWNKLLSGEDDHRMPDAIARGDVFGFRDPDKAEWAGMMILQWNPSDWDHRLWGNEDGRIEQAVYIHRLMVNRDYSGKGLGSAFLKWAETGASYPGKEFLRLDCIGHNQALNRFYPSCGFRYCGEKDGFHLYDKPIPNK